MKNGNLLIDAAGDYHLEQHDTSWETMTLASGETIFTATGVPADWYQSKIIEVDPNTGHIINEVALPDIANILFVELDDGRVFITGGRSADLSEPNYPHLNDTQMQHWMKESWNKSGQNPDSLATYFYYPLGK